MLQLGDIELARNIGKSGTAKYIWAACPTCGLERWVCYRFYKNGKYPERGACRSCSKIKVDRKGWADHGYRMVTIPKKDFYYPMAGHKGRVRLHRLIMAKHLGRCLHSWEHVHHKNGNKQDNRIENLCLTMENDHNRISSLSKNYKGKSLERVLTEEIEKKEAELRSLRQLLSSVQ